ncbi:hypothetical protein QBC46DRAFT_430115 [Diplogelasinospora grovesii]|uniref:DNA replication ATP-dependent helicase/nuclease n=1 Tax=Diplogelasinospora grovesii TaxID=303347 RepID=A0AAN6NKB2_9PEZI|nr:hypothetical protein QBC46DRAFT_430115 [Diplogelasinospora grovesii]
MPLQKSFSEQNRVSKRQQWQRSKSNPTAQSVPTKPKPLAPVSESTKNKLQAFQFVPPPLDADPDDVVAPKQSAARPAPLPGKENQPIDESAKLGKTVSPQRPLRKIVEATTPVHPRLTWQALVGIEPTPREEKEPSPTDRLEWHTEPITAPPAPLLGHKKRRKRARSTSPTSSPAAASSPAVDVKGLSEALLKTPRADPTLELWDRYCMPANGNASPSAASGLINPLLAHLLVSSSPRPKQGSETTRSDRSLRKAISCGSHWPKRRRLEVHPDAHRGTTSQGSPNANYKASFVEALLETVDREIKKSTLTEARQQCLRSPSPQKRRLSPLRERPGSRGQSDVSGSPSRNRTRAGTLGSKSGEASGDDATLIAGAGSPDKPSSDYGGDDFDDFDDDTLMELDNICSTTVSAPDPVKNPPDAAKLGDEFGDLDDDLFDGAADLVAEVEAKHSYSQQNAIKSHNSSDLPRKDTKAEEDDYGDDDFGSDFDIEEVEQAATQSALQTASASSHSSQKPKAIQRYLVTTVLESTCTDDRGREVPEKILIVQADRTNFIRTIHLRDDWYDTQASVKSYVHIIGDFEASGRCIIDNTQNILILHPDQLVSSTVVADSFNCMRRAVLQDRVKATSEASPALVYGTIIHEIFQEALMANNWDMDFLASLIAKILQKHIEDLYVIKVSMDDARQHVLSKMPELRSWAQAFVASEPKPQAVVQGRNGERANMCVSKLLDVEEHVWSPMYGLKGNIDATVQVTMEDGHESKTLTVPFEVKTGKNASSSHQAQTVLYNLLLSDRYDIEILYGVLYYTETSQTLRIPAIRHELRHMIMQRNQLACYIRERSVQLPPMKRSKNACNRCYAQTSCFIYHKLADDGDGETSGVPEKFDEVVRHLSPTHKEFFLKWENLLTKEEKESQKMRRELWTMLSAEREKVGRCFANVIIEEGSASESNQHNNQASNKINRFSYTFIKENPAPGFSFLDSQLTVGEPIVISDEQGHFALALGYVTAVRKQRISVAVDRRLHNARIRQSGFDEVNNQVFASIMQVAPEGSTAEQSEGKIKEPPIRYRLDKDEFSNGMATVRNNLVQVMADGPFGSREIRKLVVDLQPPRFKTIATQYEMPSTKDGDGLNVDQKAAVEKVMSAMDYALVLGMPGTGKTTTIAHIIRALVGQGKTVLLTSYTHTAVDNILLKLKNDRTPILRLGAPVKVHPEVRDMAFATLAGDPMGSFEEIRRAWHDTPIVATTCLGINHPIFQERTFDYCIVDEASQITLPICLGPIRMARKFVLVGDHNQLPPLVQNEEARQGGLDVSLFKLLSDTHPQSVVNLEHQYRMCEDIMTLSNTLIYRGRLKCGTESLRQAKLEVPNMEGLKQRHFDAETYLSPRKSSPKTVCMGGKEGCWLRDLLEPEARVRFINTDLLGAEAREEANKGNRIVNPCEAKVVAALVDALLTVGVPAEEIGVMTHYRSQLALLKHSVKGIGGAGNGNGGGGAIEMHTADRFQGRDKSVIVLSLVRSNDACNIGDLLRDWRRINVAFTRAKTKLLVVGSRSTLRGSANQNKGSNNPNNMNGNNTNDNKNGGGCEGSSDMGGGEDDMLARFIHLMEERDWIYDLPQHALGDHCFSVFDETSTAATHTQLSLTTSTPDIKAEPPGTGTAGGGGGGVKRMLSPKKGGRQSKLLLAQEQQQKEKENKNNNKNNNNPKFRQPMKQGKIGDKVLLKNRPILRDILNDLTDGMY